MVLVVIEGLLLRPLELVVQDNSGSKSDLSKGLGVAQNNFGTFLDIKDNNQRSLRYNIDYHNLL